VVDPEPHDDSDTIAPIIKISIYFLIYVNIRKKIEKIKFNEKKPQQIAGVQGLSMVFTPFTY
jgi:hypothetical protein